jgi:hypothetical protein
MRTEARIFQLVAVFCFLLAAVYGIWTDHSREGIEPVG